MRVPFVGASEVWPDVSKKTFERLAQFAYTGDYTVPKPLEPLIIEAAANKQEAVENEPSSSTLNEGHAIEESVRTPPEGPSAEEEFPAPAEEYVEQVAREPADEWRDWRAPTKTVPEEPIPEVYPIAPPEHEDDWGSGWGSTKKKAKKKGKLAFTFVEPESEPEPVPVPAEPEPEPTPPPTDFPSLVFPLLAPRDNHRDTCDPSEHFDASRLYTNVFLCHASLWALADIQGIDALEALALFKLHKTLCVFEIGNANAWEVIDLVRYAYSHELGKRGPDDKMTGLESLVAQYVATNSVALSRNAGFVDLLGEGGQFVKDFFKLVVERTQGLAFY